MANSQYTQGYFDGWRDQIKYHQEWSTVVLRSTWRQAGWFIGMVALFINAGVLAMYFDPAPLHKFSFPWLAEIVCVLLIAVSWRLIYDETKLSKKRLATFNKKWEGQFSYIGLEYRRG